MIQKYVDAVRDGQDLIVETLTHKTPKSYDDLVKTLVLTINPEQDDHGPDVNRIHKVNDGEYQGTLVYIIGATDYQPYRYWIIKVHYGSCGACDTFQAIQCWDDDSLERKSKAAKDFYKLILDMVSGMREV